jgi:TonB family protein
MAASVRLCALLMAGCASTATTLPTWTGNDPRVVRKNYPEFYDRAQAQLNAEFHGREAAVRAQVSPGRWTVVVRVDVDLTGDVHACRLLRSSGFGAIDEEAVAACQRVKEHLFPPEDLIEGDRLAHVPIELAVEVR